MEGITLGCWTISLERNGKIFKNERFFIQNWKRNLKEEMSLVIHMAKQKKILVLKDWIQTFLFFSPFSFIGN
jgi:hypothetical protein